MTALSKAPSLAISSTMTYDRFLEDSLGWLLRILSPFSLERTVKTTL